jgi:hypothetical protein
MLVDPVLERRPVDAQGLLDDFAGTLDVRLSVRSADHERWTKHSAVDEFLEEERPERL